jgi:hypothetical protein
VKRAELIIGKSYYMNKTTDWTNSHYGLSTSYAKTAENLKRYKVIIVETQLKTEYDKEWRTRDVLIQTEGGNLKWVPLNWIRCDWIEAVKELTDNIRQRERNSWSDRGNQYARHMARKFEREQLKPAIKNLCQEIERVTGEHTYGGDRIENLELKTLLTLTQALSFIKTDLQAVAS